jgi:HD-GYP domain-containing protein (c-di-GMP phosphodiesterase class II)
VPTFTSALPRLTFDRVPPPAAAAARASAGTVRLAEVLSALTIALDHTEGQRPGHTLRTCVLAMRLGRDLGLDDAMLEQLYYAALLKDAGCSSNAARMAALFGSDDQAVKRNLRLVDWHDRWRLAMRTAQNCGMGGSILARLRHFLLVAQTPDMTREIIQARCERGAAIAAHLGFPAASAEAIAFVDEQWCGLGHPLGLAGTEIPVLSRLLLLAQTLEVYVTEEGRDTGFRMLRDRRGRWFDPALVDLALAWRGDEALWRTLADSARLEATVVALEPTATPMLATDGRLDAIAQGFAAVIDAKSPFTATHSSNVSRYAVEIARALGHHPASVREVMRAGLLHDLGKLGISNRILDKPGALDDSERAVIRHHPKWSWQILRGVPAFASLAASASLHHERLDGTGYPWGLPAEALDETARILALADVYEALTADRPYRGPLPVPAVLRIMRADVGRAFDPALFPVVESLAESGRFAAVATPGSGIELPPPTFMTVRVADSAADATGRAAA